MARSESQVCDSLVPALRLHSWNVFPCLSAERPASPGRAASPCCARLDDLGCLGWKPNGELCMSPLQQGVLRELVLFQAAQAQLRLLQPHQGGERHGTTCGSRLLAVALVHRVNAQVLGPRIDPEKDLIEIPPVAWARATRAQPLGVTPCCGRRTLELRLARRSASGRKPTLADDRFQSRRHLVLLAGPSSQGSNAATCDTAMLLANRRTLLLARHSPHRREVDPMVAVFRRRQ